MSQKVNELDVKTCFNNIIKKEALLIDIREEHEIEGVSFDVPNRVDIPMSSLIENLEQIPKNKNVIIACRTGIRAFFVIHYLLHNNYKSIFNLSGGIVKWEEDGLPIVGDIQTALQQ